MKKTTLALVITLFSTSACLSTFSYADGPGGQQNQQWQPRQGQQDHGGQRAEGGPGRQGGRGAPGGHNGRGNARAGERDHFAWNGHDFRRGHPAPRRYRGDDYRVNDWRDRGLYEPPRGQHWAYIDGNYVLIAVATGVITSIILGSVLQH